MRLKRTVFCCLLLPVVFLLVSCQTVPVEEPLEIEAGKVAVLYVESLHNELAEASLPVHDSLVKKISDKGYRVVPLSRERYAAIHEQALVISGSVYDPSVGRFMALDRAVYIKAMVDLVAETLDADLVLVPELVLRTATVAGDKAEWDGVEREIVFASRPEKSYKLPDRAKGLSLRLAAYTRHGAEVFLDFSGISLPYQVRYVDGKFLLELKKAYFTNGEVNEGVALSLQPFFKQVKQKNGQ